MGDDVNDPYVGIRPATPLKVKRMRLGLSQRDVALALGTSKRMVGFWESWDKVIAPQYRAKYAKLLHVSDDWLDHHSLKPTLPSRKAP